MSPLARRSAVQRSRTGALLAGSVVLACGAVVMSAYPAAAQPSITYSNPDGPATGTVPAGDCAATFDAVGGTGGNGVNGSAGGLAGEVVTTLAVTPGEGYTVRVGSAGSDGQANTYGNAEPGGDSGGQPSGGTGGQGYGGENGAGGAGGGAASSVTLGTATSPVIVAAGGGGAGGDVETAGGNGGVTGGDGMTDVTGAQGDGATAHAPGAGGQDDSFPGAAGSGSVGGAGGDAADHDRFGGGGGGGGAFGGGGGAGSLGGTPAGGGGGGGSNLAPTGSTTDGTEAVAGQGHVTVSFASCVAPAFVRDTPTPSATAGTPYSYTFTATGDPTYAVASGTLPPGVSLDPATGVLSGAPARPGSFSFVISATNPGGTTTTTTLTITVAAVASTATPSSPTTPSATPPATAPATAQLPFTGIDAAGLAATGLLTALGGLTLRLAGRRRGNRH